MMQDFRFSTRFLETVARRRALITAPLMAVACSAETVSIGADAPAGGDRRSACSSSAVGGDIEVRTEADLDALEGCEEVRGDLAIHWFPGMDLGPLRSLRAVGGTLWVGTLEPVAPTASTASLAGLEALESVGSLQLSNLEVPDLLALSRLSRVGSGSGAPLGEVLLSITGCHRLQDLTGLDGVAALSSLSLGGSEGLRSLRGLSVGESLGTLELGYLPALSDIGALSSVRFVERASVYWTGLESLDLPALESAGELRIESNPSLGDLRGLRSLKRVGKLGVADNATLVDLRGLSSLTSVSELRVTDNALLEELMLAPLVSLEALDYLEVARNPELRSVPFYSGGGGSALAFYSDESAAVPSLFTVVEIADNDKLVHASLPRGHYQGQYVGVHDNRALEALYLSSLTRVDLLNIHGNPSLSKVDSRQLVRAYDLQIYDNPALPTAQWEAVDAPTRRISGNLAP